MIVVCGTDLSESAAQGSKVAAALAERLGVPLKLVHVHDAREGELVEIATTERARLLVVSVQDEAVAERVAQTSPVPVLVARQAASLEAWLRGERPLRVLVGVDVDPTSRAALRWAATLRSLGPCELFVTQVAWPPAEHVRLGIPFPVPMEGLRPELEEPLLRDLEAWAGDLAGAGATTFTVSAGWGRVDSHLAALAEKTGVDLLVVGTSQRAKSGRLWHGSVSRGVVRHSRCNVACVPRSGVEEEKLPIPTFRRVLVPTDFSPLANRAVLAAYGLTERGGVVHLLHVVTRGSQEGTSDPEQRLLALIPQGAAARGIVTEVEIVREEDAFLGIWHAAGRLGVDAICMSTHGRSGLSRLVLGSQAQEVVKRSRTPVLLVPPERGGSEWPD